MTTALSVNLNKVALLRNQRALPYPSLPAMARIVLEAGAAGITIHPRPDERHIRIPDVYDLSKFLRDTYRPGKHEFNIEGYPSEEFLDLVEEVVPDQVTLVPDAPGQSTSDHGWNIAKNRKLLARVVARLKNCGIRVSLFVDATPSIAAQAADLSADRVELYTGPYGVADSGDAARYLDNLSATAEAARRLGLGVNAGHDLTLDNLPALIARAPYIAEVSIGHAFTCDGLIYGFEETTKKYLAALESF